MLISGISGGGAGVGIGGEAVGVGGAGVRVANETTSAVGVAGSGKVKGVAVGLSGANVAEGDGGAAAGPLACLQAEAVASAAIITAHESAWTAVGFMALAWHGSLACEAHDPFFG